MTRPDDALYRFRIGLFTVLRAVLVALLLFSLLVGPVLVLNTGWAMALGWVLFIAGLIALWSAWGMALYPAHTTGIEHRVDEATFDGPRKHCTECGTRTTQGLRRRYARQAVVLGIPLHTFEWGVNDYCLECAQPGGGPGVDPESASGHVQTNDESAARELERAFEREEA